MSKEDKGRVSSFQQFLAGASNRLLIPSTQRLLCTTGACRWFLGDQTTPDTPTGNTSTCEGCRSGCQAAPNCYYLSWNNGPVTSYTATTVCGGTPTPSPRPTPAPTPMPPAICEW